MPSMEKNTWAAITGNHDGCKILLLCVSLPCEHMSKEMARLQGEFCGSDVNYKVCESKAV